MQQRPFAWSIIVACGVIPAVAVLAVGSGARDRSIAAEPLPVAPLSVVPVDPPGELPGLATPRFSTDRDARPARASSWKLKLELIDPWTGEDLAPVLAALDRPHLEVDRRDPWDPSLRYPEIPSIGDPPPDTRDPWLRTADQAAPPAAIAKAIPNHDRRAAPALDTSNPWAAPATNEATAHAANAEASTDTPL